MRLSVVHTKGGVGKTTSALYLAAAAVRRGLTVAVFDADPQGSALVWAEHAIAAGDPLPFRVIAAGPRALAHPQTAELIIIDTPPGRAAAIDAAIDAADLVLIPTGASPLDLQRVWPTLEVTGHRPSAVMLTSVDLRARTTLVQGVRDVLDDAGVAVLDTAIGYRQALRHAFGTAPIELHGYDTALTELLTAT
jgi:chromosome partitioning protein